MRIKYIDGMRGLAVLMVLFSHLIVAFYPVLYPAPSLSNYSLNELLEQPLLVKIFVFTPLNIIYNGPFAVSVFLLISGYVLSYNCFHNKDENYIASCFFKRYFRLTIPILFSCFISYFLLKFNAFNNLNALNSRWMSQFFSCDANFFDMIKFALYDQYFGSSGLSVCYNPILWMIPSLLFGSYLIYAFCALFARSGSRLKIFFYIALVIIFSKTIFLSMILGMILCDMDANKIFQNVNKYVLLIMLLPGIYLGSFIRPDLPFYTIFNTHFMNNYFDNWISLLYFCYNIGAMILFFVLSRLSFSIKIFSNKFVLYLGKISFSMYLLHFILICSLSTYVYAWLMRNSIIASYDLSFLITLAITIIVTIPLSHLFYKYVELRSLNISKLLYEFINR